MDAFIGEIRVFPYQFAPIGWLYCEGQQLQISQYTALYSLLGTVYGGDGRQTFNLPDLRGRAVVAALQSGHPVPGLTPYEMGETAGVTGVQAPLASHSHQPMSGFTAGAQPTATPGPAVVAESSDGNEAFVLASGAGTRVRMAPSSISPALGNASGVADPHANVQPYQTFHFAICCEGEYPYYP